MLWDFQGEEQKKLDVLSNDVFIKALVSSGRTVSSLTFFVIVIRLVTDLAVDAIASMKSPQP